jgi:S1-C subfamily serine protease
MNEDQVKSLGIPTNVNGVYVSDVTADGGAAAAGLKKGDVIIKVNNNAVNSGLQMSAQIAGFRPGDKVPVTYVRGGKEYTTQVMLKKRTDVVSNNISTRLGGELSTLDKSRAAKYGLSGGVVVNRVTADGVLGRARVQQGFIITGLVAAEGEVEINSLEDLNEALSGRVGTVRVTGVYPGYGEAYTYPLNLGQ